MDFISALKNMTVRRGPWTSPVLGTRKVTQPWLWAQRGPGAWLEGTPGGEQPGVYPAPWAWGHMRLLCAGTWSGSENGGVGGRNNDSGVPQGHWCQLWGPLSSSPDGPVEGVLVYPCGHLNNLE